MEASAKLDILINRRSGTVLGHGEEQVKADLLRIFGDRVGEIRLIEGSEIASSVREWAKENAGKEGRGLIIGGGDGTVLTAAEQVMGREDITLGLLPLGTHNLFARQLGFAADFREAASQYSDVTTRPVDVGCVNGMHFLVGVLLGDNCANYYVGREEWRDKKRMPALKKFFSMAVGVFGGRRTSLEISTNDSIGATVVSEERGCAFAVTNNVLEPRATTHSDLANVKAIIENVFAKGDQSDGQLAFYSFRGGIHNVLAILNKVRKGSWTRHSSVSSRVATEMTIDDPKRAPGAVGKISMVLDGEPKETTFPVKVSLVRHGLQFFQPR